MFGKNTIRKDFQMQQVNFHLKPLPSTIIIATNYANQTHSLTIYHNSLDVAARIIVCLLLCHHLFKCKISRQPEKNQ